MPKALSAISSVRLLVQEDFFEKQQADEMAGIDPEDINLIEFHNAFAPEEIVHYEDLAASY